VTRALSRVSGNAGSEARDLMLRLVAQICPRWNRLADWLRQAELYSAAAVPLDPTRRGSRISPIISTGER